MTISSTNRKAGPYVGNDVSVSFPFAFKVFSTSDVYIVFTSADNVESVLTLTTHYTVSLNSNQDTNPGGTVTLPAALATGTKLTITSAVAYLQPVDLTNNGGFYPAVINKALDRATIQIQQLADKVGRALMWPISSSSGTLPQPVGNAVIGWNSSGTSLINIALAAGDSIVDLAQAAGSSLVGFIQSGAGASVRTSQDKLRESVSVSDFITADPSGVADSYPAFSSSITSLPSGGGRIRVPPGVWKLDTEPTWGTKSIYWDIDPSAVFTGAGTGATKFPYQKLTNGGQMVVGPWIQSQSSQHSSSGIGGIAAMAIEMIQPASYGAGQSVALFLGANGSSADPLSNVWALNPLIRAESGAAGVYQCIEVDVDNFSASANCKGISINGVGTNNITVGLELIRANATKYVEAIHIYNSIRGIVIEGDSGGLVGGLIVGNPSQLTGSVTAKQLVNNGDAIYLQRITDSAPTGYFIRGANAANNTAIFCIDVSGNSQFKSSLLTGGAVGGAAGQIALGNSTAVAATAGGLGAAPAQVSLYWTILVGSTVYKIPLYNS